MHFVGIILFLILPVLVAGWILSCVAREYRNDRVPVLLYHRLVHRADATSGAVADDEMVWASYDDAFADQMGYLKEQGYRSLDMSDYAAVRAGRAELPPRPVIITFDDGYESNYSIAYPILRKHGLTATIYVALEPDEHTRALVEGIDGFLSMDQIKEMSDNGVSIQSHTLSHRLLTELEKDEVSYELTESRRRIAAITGKPVEHLAIPRAGYSRRIRRLAESAGYRTVCCNNKGSASGLSNLLALPRIVVERDMTLEDFRRNLQPSAGVMLRILGNVKRIPERIAGPRFAFHVRQVLYGSRLRRALAPATLKWILAAGSVVYLVAAVLFWVRVFA